MFTELIFLVSVSECLHTPLLMIPYPNKLTNSDTVRIVFIRIRIPRLIDCWLIICSFLNKNNKTREAQINSFEPGKIEIK